MKRFFRSWFVPIIFRIEFSTPYQHDNFWYLRRKLWGCPTELNNVLLEPSFPAVMLSFKPETILCHYFSNWLFAGSLHETQDLVQKIWKMYMNKVSPCDFGDHVQFNKSTWFPSTVLEICVLIFFSSWNWLRCAMQGLSPVLSGRVTCLSHFGSTSELEQ